MTTTDMRGFLFVIQISRLRSGRHFRDVVRIVCQGYEFPFPISHFVGCSRVSLIISRCFSATKYANTSRIELASETAVSKYLPKLVQPVILRGNIGMFMTSEQYRLVTLLSDFGLRDGYVAAMKGVILSEAPGVTLVDAGHDIVPQDVRAAAWSLGQYWNLYPAGTIHVAVVDPGVGSARAALIAEADGHLFLAPDNGLLRFVQQQTDRFSAFAIPRNWHRPGVLSNTFHGRDVFAYAAGVIAAGKQHPSEIGVPVQSIEDGGWMVSEKENDCLTGEVIHIDHFGNLITSISRQQVQDTGWRDLHIEARGYVFDEICSTYSDVEEHHKVVLFGSGDMLELAVRNGSAARSLGLLRGEKIFIKKNKIM